MPDGSKKKSCTMNSSEKELLYEIKERITKIEDEQKSVAVNLNEAKILLKEREIKYDENAKKADDALKEHMDKDDKVQKELLIQITKYDGYFKLRNEIKNAAVVLLVGACGSMLTYILFKR